ncbi:MAG: YicC/YloC family endoribonuclease, partial [Bacteroidota bacterium]
MMQSMTGYHKLSFDHADKTIHIEIKSLNSKHADISMYIPPEYKEKELALRDLIKQYLKRGKVEYTVCMDKYASDDTATINKTAFASYYRQLKDISENENIPMDPNIMQVISRMPDIMKQEQKKLSDEEWEYILSYTKTALENVVQYRINEGRSMYKDIKASAENIITLLTKIKPFEETRIKN